MSSPDETADDKDLPNVLIAEDNRADVFLIREALRRSGLEVNLHIVTDGEEAMRFFDEVDTYPGTPCPDLVLLDINMPRYKGGEILKHLRTKSSCAHVRVLVVTSSNSDADRAEMESLGATGYFQKPSAFDDFMKLGPLVGALLAKQNPNGQMM